MVLGVAVLLFVCLPDNDVFLAAQRSAASSSRRFDDLASALAAAKRGNGLLVMASAMLPSTKIPQSNTTVAISAAQWAQIAALELRSYVEFPRWAPPALLDGSPSYAATPLAVRQTMWERAIVTQDSALVRAHGLVPLALLHPHKLVDFVVLPTPAHAAVDLVLATVAGFDNASLGLPPPNRTWSLLVESSDRSLLVAATQISRCATRRFAPSARWMVVVRRILAFVTTGGGAPRSTAATPLPPLWSPVVTPSWSATEALPPSAERDAVARGVAWFRRSMSMPGVVQASQLASLHCQSGAGTSDGCSAFARGAGQFEQNVSGDGLLGIFEGFTSDIALDGSQPRAIEVRDDCVSETSSSFATLGALLAKEAAETGDTNTHEEAQAATRTASNLLSFAHLHSGFHQVWTVGAGSATASAKPWVVRGDAFGILSWETGDNAFTKFYKDDDARAILAAMATASLSKTERWHSTIATAVLGNLRATSRAGFGPSSATFASLTTKNDGSGGWTTISNDETVPSTFSPHYDSYIWAAYLAAHAASGYAPLYERASAAIAETMAGYPSKWIPTSNGIAMQRARMILPLAFLVRANDTTQHRAWLHTAVDGLLTRQRCAPMGLAASSAKWCAIQEELSAPGWGGSTRVPTNENYGTFEAPLNQENSDPVSDFLYTTNFALLGLHEAAAATQNKTIIAAENALAEFVVRAQARSSTRPEIDGAWFRAFRFDDTWESWGSDSDVGWGAWSVETGWSQSWVTTTLAMRLLNTSLWELATTIEGLGEEINTWAPTMAWQAPTPSPPALPCLPVLISPRTMPLNFTVATTLEPLCSKGGAAVHVRYSGVLCKAAPSRAIQWNSMVTLDPAAGPFPGGCAWSREKDPADVPEFFGECGVAPSALALPVEVCAK